MSLHAALDDVTVIDLSLQLPGPYATLLLAALGATIIKVEPPGGDPAREIDPDMFRRVNAGKQLLELDLKSADGRAALHELVAGADVVVEGFRPGVTRRLGAGWETLAAINPRLIYCSLSGFGPEGPMAGRPGHDLNFLALAGGLGPHAAELGDELIRIPFVDLAAGTNAALAITAALARRESEQEGCHLEIPLLDAAIVWSEVKAARDGGEGAYGVFETADGRRVAVAVMEPAMWRRMGAALGWREWLDDPDYVDHTMRRGRADEIRARLKGALRGLRQDQAIALGLEHDLAITAVNAAGAARHDEQVRLRDVLGDQAWSPLAANGARLPYLELQ